MDNRTTYGASIRATQGAGIGGASRDVTCRHYFALHGFQNHLYEGTMKYMTGKIFRAQQQITGQQRRGTALLLGCVALYPAQHTYYVTGNKC